MDARPGEISLAAGTPIRLGCGTVVDIGQLVPDGLSPGGGSADAGRTVEVLVFDPGHQRPVRRTTVVVRRAPGPDAGYRIELATGARLTTGPDTGVLTVRDASLGITRAAELRAGDACAVPRLAFPAVRTAASDALSRAASRTLHRRPSPVEVVAGAMTGPAIRLPLRVDPATGWLIGALLAAGGLPPDLAANMHTAVFGFPPRRTSVRRCEFDHPTVRHFLTELGALAPTVPPWLDQVTPPELGLVLSGLLDTAGSIRPAHRQIVLRVPEPRGSALRRLLHGHGLVAGVRPAGAGYVTLGLVRDDAIAAARLMRPCTPRQVAARRRLVVLGAGHGPSLGPQPHLVGAVVDEVRCSGGMGRVHAIDTIAAAFGIGERAVYELLAGHRALHWDELGGVANLDPALHGGTLDRLRDLRAHRLVPVPVTAVDPVPRAEDGYTVTVVDGPVGLLADDVAITSCPGQRVAG